MQKVILDTNVVVSALIQRSFPYLILTDFFSENRFQLCISEQLMAEYYEVLRRDKFAKFADFSIKADSILADIERKAKYYLPTKKVRKIKDPDDNMLLELALECNADLLITGNTRDFTITNYRKTKIVTPKVYWEDYRLKK